MSHKNEFKTTLNDKIKFNNEEKKINKFQNKKSMNDKSKDIDNQKDK